MKMPTQNRTSKLCNQIKPPEQNAYATADLALSAFLQAMGYKILAVRSEGKRGVFVFSDSPDLRQDIIRWSNNEPISIKVRSFVNGLRDLKGVVGT